MRIREERVIESRDLWLDDGGAGDGEGWAKVGVGARLEEGGRTVGLLGLEVVCGCAGRDGAGCDVLRGGEERRVGLGLGPVVGCALGGSGKVHGRGAAVVESRGEVGGGREGGGGGGRGRDADADLARFGRVSRISPQAAATSQPRTRSCTLTACLHPLARRSCRPLSPCSSSSHTLLSLAGSHRTLLLYTPGPRVHSPSSSSSRRCSSARRPPRNADPRSASSSSSWLDDMSPCASSTSPTT